ncbi:MAG: hypothetical protein ABL930_05615 [Pseudobdellovibrio sp.]
MQLKSKLAVYMLAIGSLILLNSGCNGVKSGEASFGSLNIPAPAAPAAPAPPVVPTPSSPPGSSNGIEDDASFFYVGVQNDENDSIAHVHDSTDFSKTCSVPKTSLAHEDITCLIDIPEGDIYNKDLVLQYNAPAQMCRYLVRAPYWFYNREVGIGPETIAISVDNTVNASGDITASTYTCAFDGVTRDCANGDTEVAITGLSPTSQEIKCVYDFNGTNCCMGSYTLNRTILTNGANPVAATPANFSWGGNMTNCIGGAGKTDWNVFNADKTPNQLVQYSWQGIKNTYLVTAPSHLGTGGLPASTSSIHVANFYGQAVDHTHTGFVNSADSTTRPYFSNPIDDRSGTDLTAMAANDSYLFLCYNEAYEIKHRIRAYVREWDYYPDYLTFISSLGLTVQPDKSSFLDAGPEETDPTCLEGIAGNFCNDSGDIDDFLNLEAATNAPLVTPFYDMTTVTKRRSYFPFIEY